MEDANALLLGSGALNNQSMRMFLGHGMESQDGAGKEEHQEELLLVSCPILLPGFLHPFPCAGAFRFSLLRVQDLPSSCAFSVLCCSLGQNLEPVFDSCLSFIFLTAFNSTFKTESDHFFASPIISISIFHLGSYNNPSLDPPDCFPHLNNSTFTM